MKRRLENYIELLDEYIRQTIREEVDNGALTSKNEYDLHVALENRKHAIEWLKEHEKAADVKATR